MSSLLRDTVGHLRDLPRYRQILGTLVKYGYQDVVAALHLEKLVDPIARAALGGQDNVPPIEPARRVRMVCEDLGPTFVKLGQVLSTRRDLVPEPFLSELAHLRDDVRPFPFEQAEKILTEDLGRPPLEVFETLDPEPVASASISQVHRATLPDGTPVALKIRRPGIDKVVQADLDILQNLAGLAERRLPALAAYHPVSFVHEFERTIKKELDLGTERHTMERCRIQLANLDFVRVPAAFPDLSTSRVLCMEFVGGVSVDDLDGIRALGLDPAEVAIRGAKVLLTQIFEHGFFHADPHPGNLRVLAGGVIAPLDYGMFGHLDQADRQRIAELLLGLMAQDTDRVLRALDRLEIRGEHVDPRALRRDVAELVATYSDLSLDRIDLPRLLARLVELVRHHHLRIPPDLMLLIRSLVTIEGVGRRLDPRFDIAAQIHPFVRSLMLKRFTPWTLLGAATRSAEDLQRVAMLLPEALGQALESFKRGELTVRFDLQHFERLVQQLIRAANMLTSGIVVAGLLVGSSMLVEGGGSGVSLGYGGYTMALVLGLWLVWNMIRKG